MNLDRVVSELERLHSDGIVAELHRDPRAIVLYRDVPSDGARLGLSATIDVAVPVPDGYAQSLIDLAGLPAASPLFARVKGGNNPQGDVVVSGVTYRFASYHPHNGGGGPSWNPLRHGFHTYYDQLIAWLHALV